jgi:glyoxylase-like metal-dependent hydrolase (beta-lactamase superfamily II)
MTSPLPDYLQPLGYGIYAVDTGFHRPAFDAAYLLVDAGRAAYIDTGTNHAVPRLLGALAALGLPPGAVDWVIPTHVHLDHAGGVGALMRELPQARLVVHPRGERHLIDPQALWQGALAVYGLEEMQRSYGELLPVPAERVSASSDGQRIALGERELVVAHTPGHARHHHCIWDEVSRGWFTGDTFGLSYREFDTAAGAWIMPTTTPVQFEPEALHASIRRLLEREPQSVYLTHYGRVGDVQRLGRQLIELLDAMVALGRAARDHGDRHAALKRGLLELLQGSLRAPGCTLPSERIEQLLAMDLELNAQGMAIWLDRG